MKDSDIVLILSINVEGMLMGRATDLESGKRKCVVFCGEFDDGPCNYIVDEDDLKFVETLEESLERTLSNNYEERKGGVA